jgi:hypothetical protein
MIGSLHFQGVFCGSFVGQLNSMAISKYDRNAFWPAVGFFAALEDLR